MDPEVITLDDSDNELEVIILDDSDTDTDNKDVASCSQVMVSTSRMKVPVVVNINTSSEEDSDDCEVLSVHFTHLEVARDKSVSSDASENNITSPDTPMDDVNPFEASGDDITSPDTPRDDVNPSEASGDDITSPDTPKDDVNPFEASGDDITSPDTPRDDVNPSEASGDDRTSTEMAENSNKTSKVDKMTLSEVSDDNVTTAEVACENTTASNVAGNGGAFSEALGDKSDLADDNNPAMASEDDSSAEASGDSSAQSGVMNNGEIPSTSSGCPGSSQKKEEENNLKIFPENRKYSFTCYLKEDHGSQIYGCQFHQYLEDGEPTILATIGGNRVSIYECTPVHKIRHVGRAMTLLQCYKDPDPEEKFYTCAWTNNNDGVPLLAAAGNKGIIRLFSFSLQKCIKGINAHGGFINEIKFHPRKPQLLISASKDESIKLWNINTECCIAIFGGIDGHRDQIISVDVDPAGTLLVSCGVDHSIKLWHLAKPDIQTAIQDSDKFDKNSGVPFITTLQLSPVCYTDKIHNSYVDCVKFVNDWILSKSCENKIHLWKFGNLGQKTWKEATLCPYDKTRTNTTILHTFEMNDCKVWFIKFALDIKPTTIAVGNAKGTIFLYDLSVKTRPENETSILSHSKCNSPIRQISFSRDGSILVGVCDDSTVWRWDTRKSRKGKAKSKNIKKGSR